MALKSRERNLSFDVLRLMEDQNDDVLSVNRSFSDPLSLKNASFNTHHQSIGKNKNRKRNKNKFKNSQHSVLSEIGEIVNLDNVDELEEEKKKRRRNKNKFKNSQPSEIVNLDLYNYMGATCGTVTVVEENGVSQFGGELRQRNVGFVNEALSSSGMLLEVNGNMEETNVSCKNSEIVHGRKLETEESLDWKQFMATDPRLMENCSIETSPVKHFMEVLHTGHSLRSTVTLGNEKDRERVYDTIFRLPWRCELLIDVGFFVCLDSFLSVFTIMPVRMALTLWKSLRTRQFHKPSAEELSDFGCLLVLASGVNLLQQIDISLIYHMIRGQGTIKLYVVYNVLEIFDKLFQSFVGDVMQTVFNSANGLANCSPENIRTVLPRFISDVAITLSTCIVAHNNALFALLVSNNFAEIKSNVFKRFSKDNVHSIVYSDSVERFHICAFLLFVLAQNLLEAEGPWFSNFLSNALLVYICEVLIDIIKHSFIAKFNDIKPIAFSEYLEDLSKQTLNQLTEAGKRKLIFVPLSPACVVLRVLQPVYAAHLPYNSLPWRLVCMFLLSGMTFMLLGVLKIMVSMGLKKHASWYVKRCEKRKSHTD
ncbi:hypothetical protein LIER_32675 [Lithospermum erythrorhizon]|uniref:Protein POLLEN DEFECTIVE IN GUIDANCE 1 n=1 Tax=Lithospermum erythrorhizon TaxID=34254 RepID=A0AAV3RYJ6_LITER